jgi:hypothetical protein
MILDGSERYMEGALRLLQFVESRRSTGRRFGPDADARWSGFRGDLETVDRIELMIRDADAEWPAGFGARVVYALPGVPEDEPFGSQWEGMDPVAAEELWRKVKTEPSPQTPRAALNAIAAAWGIKLAKVDLGKVGATDQFVIVGASAIASAIDAFASGSALDWADQVLVLATEPSSRQLAASATALLNSQRAGRILSATEAANAKPVRGARLIASDDAAVADRSAAEKVVAG